MDSGLMEAPEEEEDIDLMNDETFGDNIDGMYYMYCVTECQHRWYVLHVLCDRMSK